MIYLHAPCTTTNKDYAGITVEFKSQAVRIVGIIGWLSARPKAVEGFITKRDPNR
jgi:hypothetical protein